MFSIVISMALLALVVVYFVALGVTNRQQRAAMARLDEPPIVEMYRQRAPTREVAPDERDAGASVGPGDNGRRSIEHFDDVTRAMDEFSANATWERLCNGLPDLDDLSADEWRDLEAMIDDHQAILDRVRALSSLGGPFAVLDLASGYSEHWSVLRNMGLLLEADTRIMLGRGDMHRAADNLTAMIQLAEALADEPLIMSQLVRFVLYWSACSTIAEHVPPAALPVSHERSLIARLGEGINREYIARAYYGEAVLGQHWFNHPDMDAVFPDAESPFGQWIEMRLLWIYTSTLGRPLLKRDATSYIEMLADLQEIARSPYVEAAPQLAALEHATAQASWSRVFTRRAVGQSFFNFPIAGAIFEARIAITQVGMTIERYRAETGALPVTLDEIAERLPGGCPLDPFTGNALVYRPSDTPFLLYSVGENLTDDGGRHARSGGDNVWRGGRQRH